MQFSPEFWGDHLSKFNASLNEVSLLIKRNHGYGQLKETRLRIETIIPVIADYLNQLFSIFSCVNLKVLIKKTNPFFEDLHIACEAKDPEKLVIGLTQLKQSIFPYIKQLEKSGFDHGLQAQLDAYISIINAESIEIKSILTEQAQWEENNKVIFDNLRNKLDHILTAGKKLHRKNWTKQQDYTIEHIVTNVFQEATQLT
jgi:hypothetical protein